MLPVVRIDHFHRMDSGNQGLREQDGPFAPRSDDGLMMEDRN
jgi:hypothetical protein